MPTRMTYHIMSPEDFVKKEARSENRVNGTSEGYAIIGGPIEWTETAEWYGGTGTDARRELRTRHATKLLVQHWVQTPEPKPEGPKPGDDGT